jgi:ABC-type antimicrobial peptide transport system permease subunit
MLFKISGIFSKVPASSTLQFSFVIPFSRFLSYNPGAYETGASSNLTWIVLNEANDKNRVNSKIKDLIKGSESTLNQELFLFPLKDKALYRYPAGKRAWGEMQNVIIVAAVGLVILLIACFNFINLAVAMNMRRFLETGIKKVVGSKKSIIVYQFLGETFALIFVSLLSAIFLVYLTLPLLNAATGRQVEFRLSDPALLLLMLLMAVVTVLISGLFPALYLASSRPAIVLKGGKITGHSYSAFRQGMIVFQFAIPVSLIICMMIIKVQDSYMRNFDFGFDKEKLIIINNNDALQKHEESFRSDVQNVSGISGISFTNCIPSRNAKVTNDVSWTGKEATEKLHFWLINTDFDYNRVVNVQIKDGRYFDRSMASDSGCYVINDIAADVMKLKNPVGASISPEGTKGTVIGVFRNFHAIDLAGPYVPVIIRINPADRQYVLIRYQSGNYPEMIQKLEEIYRRYDPESVFEPVLFSNLSSFSNLVMPAGLMAVAFVIALLLACMGLYGLASFTSESRTKEIGIRKAHGAKTITIMRLLTGNYFKWLILATILSLPVVLLFGNSFLGRFNFHASIPLWVFIAGPFVAIMVAILTVSIQTWGVAKRNPVDALRNE